MNTLSRGKAFSLCKEIADWESAISDSEIESNEELQKRIDHFHLLMDEYYRTLSLNYGGEDALG